MIGFFDSGVGGLTVLEHVHRRLPAYDTFYFGDTAHAPFGNKTHEEIFEYTWEGCKRLFNEGCGLVIVACNSASSSALRRIQQERLSEYPGKRVLGVIRPTVEELARKGHKEIAVLSTVATKASGAYVKEFEKLNADIHVISHACPNWAPLVEQGMTDLSETKADVERELQALDAVSKTYDAILLGCTHYPVLLPLIKAALPRPVPVYEQGPIVAESLADYLNRHPEIESTLTKNSKRFSLYT
ncbi:MAG: glutamate racemase [Patescibacteria group bacterium]